MSNFPEKKGRKKLRMSRIFRNFTGRKEEKNEKKRKKSADFFGELKNVRIFAASKFFCNADESARR